MNNWDYQQFLASGYSDAGFRLLTQQATLRIIQQNHLKSCQVITFGQTQWTGFQKIRKNVVLRWTNDFAPRFLYCYDEDEMGNISMPKLLRQIRSGDLDPTELWVGGEITELFQGSEYKLINKRQGVKEVVDALKEKITEDLLFCPLTSTNTEEN